MAKRKRKMSFVPGMWVFPGGAMDLALDDVSSSSTPHQKDQNSSFDELSTFRRCAARELEEEAGIVVPDPIRLVPFSHWLTPKGQSRRFDTWFFLYHLKKEEEESIIVKRRTLNSTAAAPSSSSLHSERSPPLERFPTLRQSSIDANELDDSVCIPVQSAIDLHNNCSSTGGTSSSCSSHNQQHQDHHHADHQHFFLPMTTLMLLDHLSSFKNCSEALNWARTNEALLQRDDRLIAPVDVPPTKTTPRQWLCPWFAMPHYFDDHRCGGEGNEKQQKKPLPSTTTTTVRFNAPAFNYGSEEEKKNSSQRPLVPMEIVLS